jgi:predicted permease
MNDLRFVFRMAARNPGYAAITILTLALGIAGNVVIFTIFNAFFLRPFPFPEPSQLVDLDETAPRWNLEYTGLAYPDFHSWRELSRSFQGMAAWTYADYNLSFQGGAARARGSRVTFDLSSVLGIKPILGRPFAPEEDRPGGVKVLLLGNGFWKRQFGASKDIVGQTLKLNQDPFTIIGVLPPDKEVLLEADFWVPLAMDPNNLQQGWFLRGIGRLKEGVSLGMAREDLRGVHRSLVEKKTANENTSPRLTTLNERFFGSARIMVQLLLGAVGVVLLIACGNVAALMLARGLARNRELGLRMCLGATQRRLARLIGMESLLLAGFGGIAGMILGYWSLQALLHSLTETPPRWIHFDLDWRVCLFAGSMVVISSLLGALPVIASISKLDLHGVFQSSAQQSTTAGRGIRSLHVLVVAEVALTLLVMIQAGLLVQAFQAVQKVDPGFQPDHVLVYEIDLPSNRYESREAKTAFFRSHLERVRGLPGVASASAVSSPPLGGHWGNFFAIENALPKGPNEPDPVVLQRIAFPDYFETMRIPLLAGRSFTDRDGENEGSLAVIVNEAFAKRFWPGHEAIGKRIQHRGDKNPWMTVVGVAKDIKHYGLDRPMIPGVYIPFAHINMSQMAVVVRSSVAPESLTPSVRALVRQSDPDLPIFGVVSMEERLSRSMWMRRLCASLFGLFSGLALFMAIGGIYGVFSYAVSRRSQELGIRLALGAQRRQVLCLVLRQGMTVAGIGIGVGILGALFTAYAMKSLLLGINPWNPVTYASIGALLACVALLASWLPARRAATVNPMEALRNE